MPLPKVAPQGGRNIQINDQSVEPIPIDNGSALNARLETIFAESPWTVTAEDAGGGSYTYYFRQRTGDPRPITLVTSNNPLFLLRSPDWGQQYVLLIRLPNDLGTSADYDKEDRAITFNNHGDEMCQYPSYLGVGTKSNFDDQVIEMTHYRNIPTGLHVSHDGSLVSPVGQLLHPSCFAKEPKKMDDMDIDPNVSSFILEGRLSFDMSGSVNPSLYFTLFKERMAKDIYMFAHITENQRIDKECGDRWTREWECEEKLYKKIQKEGQSALFGVGYYLGKGSAGGFKIPFELCKVTACGKIRSHKDALEAARPVLDTLLATVERRLEAITPAGPDTPHAAPPTSLLETTFFQAPYGQNIAGRGFRGVCAYTSPLDMECLPAVDRKRVIEWSLKNGLPLFLSVSLAAKDQTVIPAVVSGNLTSSPLKAAGMTDHAATDREIETAIGEAFVLPPAERDDNIYERLTGFCKDKGRDRSVSGASAGLIGAWALKGDAKARRALTALFDDAENLASEEARTVVARTLSLLINDDEAKAILKRIKAVPDAEVNSVLLSALAGREEFFEGFNVLLDSYHPALYVTGRMASLAEAMRRVFTDPILQTDDLELDLTADELKLLSGSNWPNDLLQRVHERLVHDQRLSTDETADALSPLINLLQGYAVRSIARETVETSELTVNTDLTKRHIYPRLERDKIIRQGVHLARTAGREEAYLSLEPNNGDASVSPAAIEVGVLETEGSTRVPQLTRSEFERFTKAADVTSHDEMLVVHWHIHPLGLTNRHRLTDNIPSDTDLLSYLYFAREWKKKLPNADLEFRILTPYGVLFLRPTERFMDAFGTRGSMEEYQHFVGSYQRILRDSWGQITTERLRIALDEYFDVEFRKSED